MRDCRIPDARAKAAWFDPLVRARTSADTGYLRTLVEFVGQGEVGTILRMLATDRLRELGQMPKVLLPTQ